MKNEWLLDVLSDLRSFAGANGLHDLSMHLDMTRQIALSELSSSKVLAAAPMVRDDNRVGSDTRSC